jgi:hypothetical protein
MIASCGAWWYTPIIPALGKLKQKGLKLKTSPVMEPVSKDLSRAKCVLQKQK